MTYQTAEHDISRSILHGNFEVPFSHPILHYDFVEYDSMNQRTTIVFVFIR